MESAKSIISDKKNGKEISKLQMQFLIDGYLSGEIPDYQVSAFLMAVYFNGMTRQEIINFTLAMANSGEKLDLSMISGIKVDKHSSGGVGDKTTLIISPVVASLGVPVAKMSGRGLGFTGGTIDKMESIEGLRTNLKNDEFLRIIKSCGMCLAAQSGDLVPADKKIYSLRDATCTVDSIPLIASSIMSKKIAAGCDKILLDVKCGTGAFMKTEEEAFELAKLMVDIGDGVGKKTVALITDMNSPIGFNIGNSLEIEEVCETLKGRGPKDLVELCIELAGNMLYLAEKSDNLDECKKNAREVLSNGSAFKKLKEMVFLQGGNVKVLDDYNLLPKSKICYKVYSYNSGILESIDSEKCGIASMLLGAGRETKESSIDFGAGIILKKKVGDTVNKGEVLAEFYTNDEEKCIDAESIFNKSLIFGKGTLQRKMVYRRVE